MMLPSWEPGGIVLHFRLELTCFLKHKSMLILLKVGKKKKARWAFGFCGAILMKQKDQKAASTVCLKAPLWTGNQRYIPDTYPTHSVSTPADDKEAGATCPMVGFT